MKLAALILLAFVVGCGGPWGPIAGGRLTGTASAQPVENWRFAKSFTHMEIETRPDDPYSVTIYHYVIDDDLYVEAGKSWWSRWREFLHTNPEVRVRFGDTVYPARAVLVSDPAEIARVLPAFYEKDSDEPSPACRKSWTVDVCGFEGALFRIESLGPSKSS
jgi:hypothetical protein